VSGRDAEHRSYQSYVSFSDPDGNGWLLQEVTTRLPVEIDSGTTTFASTNDLASAFRRAEGRPRRAREAHRPRDAELAQLVCRVYGGGAGGQRAAPMNNHVIINAAGAPGVECIGARLKVTCVPCIFHMTIAEVCR
jgi:hypothetical protein